MRDRLFTIIDGEPVVTAPLVNLKEFRKLWEEDRTDDKSTYKKWLLFIYYMADYRSSFFELEAEDKLRSCLQEVFGRPTYEIPKKVEACIDVYRKRNTPAEQRALEGAINSLDSINRILVEFQQNSKQMVKLVNALEAAIEDALRTNDIATASALMKEKMDIQQKQLGLIKTASDLIPKIETNVESIIRLRDRVTKAMDSLNDSKEKLENYLIDEFIARKEKGEYNVETDFVL